MGLSLVIPAWNEEDRLARTLESYLPRLKQWWDPYEVIVVVDGGLDRTAEVARRYGEDGVRVLEFPRKLGKGGAVLEGLHQARFEFVGYLDADGPVPPDEIHTMAVSLHEYDCVVASRWLRSSRVVAREPLFNILAGRVWNFLVRSLLFLPLRDTQCGAKFLRRSVIGTSLRAVALTNRAFDVDLLYHVRKAGFNVREVPVTWTHDPQTRMPIMKAIPVMFLSLVGIRLMNLPLRKHVPSAWVRWFQHRWGPV